MAFAVFWRLHEMVGRTYAHVDGKCIAHRHMARFPEACAEIVCVLLCKCHAGA